MLRPTVSIRSVAVLLVCLAFTPVGAAAQPADRHAHPIRVERERHVDILHYRIELTLDHPRKAFTGRTAVTFNPLHPVDTLHLDAETFAVTRVSTPSGADLSFSHSDGILSIPIGRTANYGDTLTAVIEYNASEYDVRGEEYGMVQRPDLGLDFRDATPTNPALVNSLSFPEGARHWYPSHDHPAERATQEVIATVQRGWKVLSNGKLVSVTESDSTVTYHWKQSLTHPTYLSAIVAGPYEIVEDSLDGLSIDYWVYPKDKNDAVRSFGRTPEIIRFFEETYGVAFPWEKYNQVTVPGIGGGAESTSSTLIGEATIHDERADIDYSSHWLVAHEGAHQWWGNLISYRDWTHTWLAESFGSYSEVLWAEHDLGTDNGMINLLDKRSSYLTQAKNEFIRPIVYDRWEYPNNNFDRHTYQKGANVLHMLRAILGDESFFRTHKYFLTRHAYESVGTSDFMSAVKNATGRNMDWFFKQWLFQPGHPVIDATHRFNSDASTVELTLTQTQDFGAGVPVFRFPITIELLDANGARRETVWMSEKQHTFTFAAGGSAPIVVIDPDRVVLMELNHAQSQAEYRSQALHASVGGRLEAAAGLDPADTESRAALVKLVNTDAFWAVRERAVTSLTTGTDREAARLFLSVASSDKDTRVRAAAVSGLGRAGTERDAKALRTIYTTDKSYRVQAAVLDALGTIGRPSDESFIRSNLETKSPRNVLSNAATRALKNYE